MTEAASGIGFDERPDALERRGAPARGPARRVDLQDQHHGVDRQGGGLPILGDRLERRQVFGRTQRHSEPQHGIGLAKHQLPALRMVGPEVRDASVQGDDHLIE